MVGKSGSRYGKQQPSRNPIVIQEAVGCALGESDPRGKGDMFLAQNVQIVSTSLRNSCGISDKQICAKKRYIRFWERLDHLDPAFYDTNMRIYLSAGCYNEDMRMTMVDVGREKILID